VCNPIVVDAGDGTFDFLDDVENGFVGDTALSISFVCGLIGVAR
jgi:hypothetical protein